MPLPSTLPVGPLDASKIPKPLSMAPGTAFEPNSLLNKSSVVRLFEDKVLGSESVALHPNGEDLVMCDRYGYVWRASPRKEKKERSGSFSSSSSPSGDDYLLDERPLAHLGPGRPLGFDFDSHANLLVCMSGSGLVMLESSAFDRDDKKAAERARVVLLTAEVSSDDGEGNRRGSPILYANDLDVSHRTGLVYFTDSVAIAPVRNSLGFWDTMQAYIMSLAQGEATGRLLRYDPTSGETSIVAAGLWFGNGVALSPDETWAAVVETNSLRVYKIHLEGPKKGLKEVLIDGLPGYPDGISRAFSSSTSPKSSESGQDGFWLALVAPLQPAAKLVVPWKLGRLLMAWMPDTARPPLKPWGATARLRLREGEEREKESERQREDGKNAAAIEIEGWLLDPAGVALSSTSAVTDVGDGSRLFFGNLAGEYVSFIDGASEKIERAKRKARGGGSSGSGGGGSSSSSDGDKSEL